MTTESTNQQLEQKVKDLEKEIAGLNRAEGLMVQEKAFSEAIIRSLPGIFYLFDYKGTFVRWNRNFEEVSGYSAQEISRMYPLDFFEGDDKTKIGERIQETLVKGSSTAEAEFVSKSGKKAVYYLTGHRAVVGDKTYVAGMGIDITTRKRYDVALEKSEKQYKDLVENSLVGIFKTNLKGDILYANAAWAKMFGFDSLEELKSENVLARYKNPSDRDILIQTLKQSGRARNFEFQGVTKTGDVRTVLMNADLEDDMISGMVMDISEKQLTQQILMEKEADLEKKAKDLEEMNAALRVFFRKKEQDKEELEGNILLTVKQLVLPYLQELENSRLTVTQKALLGIAQSNLTDIVSPFVRKLSSQFLNLTPAEMRVADLIKQGKGNKEIAEVLRVSVYTILTHRENLRKKLELKNKKINLKSYLLSFRE